MRTLLLALVALTPLASVGLSDEPTYAERVLQWQAQREARLRADNGWLTLVGRFPLEPGENTFGSGSDNRVVFPSALAGVGPPRLGALDVDPAAGTVTLRPAEGVEMTRGGIPQSGPQALGTSPERRDWVSLGRLSFHVIEREGKFILRLADNESPLRREFPGCRWYAPDPRFRVEARFVPYAPGRSLRIVNVVDEVGEQPCPGYAEFELDGRTHRLDAIREGQGLFFIFRDATAGDTTYASGRFLDVPQQPEPQATFDLDFNQAYNPPCAWSAYTTCPLPPPQNVLSTRIEAGEKFTAKP